MLRRAFFTVLFASLLPGASATAATGTIPQTFPSNAKAKAIAATNDGGTVVAGTFSGSLALGESSLRSSGGEDVFIARYDAAGRVVWKSQLGGTDADDVADVAVHTNGTIAVAGSFKGRPLAGNRILSTSGGQTYFVGLLDAAGAWKWTAAGKNQRYWCVYIGSGSSEGYLPPCNTQSLATSVGFDRDGNVYVGGGFTGIVIPANSPDLSGTPTYDGPGSDGNNTNNSSAGSDNNLTVPASQRSIVGGGCDIEQDASRNGAAPRCKENGFIEKYRADGGQAWFKNFGETKKDPVAGQPAPDGDDLNIPTRRGGERIVDFDITPNGVIYAVGEYSRGISRGQTGEHIGVYKFDFGTSAVSAADDTIRESFGHRGTTGDGPVRVTTTSVVPAGLVQGTDYWVRVVDANLLQLYDTRDHALAGGATGRANITSTGTGSHTLTSVGLAIDGRAALVITTAQGRQKLPYSDAEPLDRDSFVAKLVTGADTPGGIDQPDWVWVAAFRAGNDDYTAGIVAEGDASAYVMLKIHRPQFDFDNATVRGAGLEDVCIDGGPNSGQRFCHDIPGFAFTGHRVLLLYLEDAGLSPVLSSLSGLSFGGPLPGDTTSTSNECKGSIDTARRAGLDATGIVRAATGGVVVSVDAQNAVHLWDSLGDIHSSAYTRTECRQGLLAHYDATGRWKWVTGANPLPESVRGECGDGRVQAGEACDDGDTQGGDGCSAFCAVENATCGNGTREGLEECDDADTSSFDGCRSNCTTERCGDFVADAYRGETCDDGNTVDGDGCENDCQSTAQIQYETGVSRIASDASGNFFAIGRLLTASDRASVGGEAELSCASGASAGCGFVARADLTGEWIGLEHWTAGRPIAPPDGDLVDATVPPEIAVEGFSASETAQFAYWSRSEKRLYAVRPTVDSAGNTLVAAPDGTRPATVSLRWHRKDEPVGVVDPLLIVRIGEIELPDDAQTIVQGAPVDLSSASAQTSRILYSDAEAALTEGNVFSAADSGTSVVIVNESSATPTVMVVRSTPFLLSPSTPLEACTVGTPIAPRAGEHDDPTGRNGLVVNDLAPVDMGGANPAYDRSTRGGPIVAVNEGIVDVAWYEQRDGLAWPARGRRYDCKWPAPGIALDTLRSAVWTNATIAGDLFGRVMV